MEPVLFLDVDGVLLPGRVHDSPGNRAALSLEKADAPWVRWLTPRGRCCATELCPIAVASLNEVLAETESRMVLISTWREEFGGSETREILTAQGLSEQWHADFCAPSVGAKGDDILAWLTAHPEVNQWAAVDDDLLWPPWGEQRIGLARNHIRPDYHEGMSPADWQMLKDRLLPGSIPL